jgi:DNA repair exonuclease SbcCD ATPase subunit
VRGHYETILRDMKRVFSEHSEGARDAYNSNVQKLQARLTAAGAEAETLRQQLAAAEAAGAWPGAAAVVPVAATVTAVAGTPGERAREMEAQLARLQADNDAKSAQLRELAAGEGESGGSAPLFPPAVAAAQPRMGRAVGRAVLALARAQVASQVQKTALAQARVEGAQKHVQAQQQQLSAAESTAREELEEAREVVAQVAPTEAPDPAGAGAGAAAAGAQMEGARQKLQQVQAELVTVRAHDAELEGQRLALEAERASMEAALRQAEAAAQAVSGAFRSCVRSVLAEIRLCHACSCQEILRTETPRQATQSEGGLRAELARLQVSRSCPVLEMSPASC